MDRTSLILEVIQKYASKEDRILEIGSGDGRNVSRLKLAGYDVVGIDKLDGTSIEDVPEEPYDVIFTMSTLFLIPKENEWVFEKIARMAKKLIITIEGETTKPELRLIGRDYTEVFGRSGFKEVEHRAGVFNKFGHLRVLKNERTN